jgi:hypothetical protein
VKFNTIGCNHLEDLIVDARLLLNAEKSSSTYSVISKVFLVTRDYRRHDDELLGLSYCTPHRTIDSDKLGKTEGIYKET